MPPIYTSYLFADNDDLETKQRKLYLGIISLGEDLYTFNASLNELRKQHADIDLEFIRIKEGWQKLRKDFKEWEQRQRTRK